MTTISLIKNVTNLVYDDYVYGKSALRIRELSEQNPAQNIKRSKASFNIEAVLVSVAWYDAHIAAFAAVGAPAFNTDYALIADDFIGSNISTMCNLIQSYPETMALQKKTVLEGSTLNAFRTYKIIGTKEFYRDGNEIVPFEPYAKVGGDVRAYLVHPKFYQSLNQTPVATVYAGVGNGTLSSALCYEAIAETIAITATDATHFNVVGSVSGLMGIAAVGTTFANTKIKLLLTTGGIAFVAGDVFTVNSFAI
jgi:hypothetical protein